MLVTLTMVNLFTTTKTICSNTSIFFRGGPKNHPFLQIVARTVATEPPLKISFLGAGDKNDPIFRGGWGDLPLKV